MYRYIKCRLKTSFHKTRERNGIPHGQQCMENRRVIESLWANLYFCMAVIQHQVCTRMRATDQVNVQH